MVEQLACVASADLVGVNRKPRLLPGFNELKSGAGPLRKAGAVAQRLRVGTAFK